MTDDPYERLVLAAAKLSQWAATTDSDDARRLRVFADHFLRAIAGSEILDEETRALWQHSAETVGPEGLDRLRELSEEIEAAGEALEE
jgi:hypothetical protein